MLHTEQYTEQLCCNFLRLRCLPELSPYEKYCSYYLCIRHFLSLLLLTCTECSLLLLKCKAESNWDRTASKSSTTAKANHFAVLNTYTLFKSQVTSYTC